MLDIFLFTKNYLEMAFLYEPMRSTWLSVASEFFGGGATNSTNQQQLAAGSTALLACVFVSFPNCAVMVNDWLAGECRHNGTPLERQLLLSARCLMNHNAASAHSRHDI